MRSTPLVLSLVLAAASGCAQEPGREQRAALSADTSGYESVMLALPAGNARAAFLGLKCTTCHRITFETRWLGGAFDISQMNAAWMILALSGLPAPLSAGALDLTAPARVLFGVAIAAFPLMMGLVFWRTVVGPPLASRLRPTSFILLVPPSLLLVSR